MKPYEINYLIELVRTDIVSYRKPGTHFGRDEKQLVEGMNTIIAKLEQLKK